MADKSDDAPLPKGWSRVYSRSSQRYYYSHEKTKHTQWHFPTASEAADPLKGKKRAEENQERERTKRSHDNTTSSNTSSSNQKPASTRPVKRQRVTTDPDAFLALADTTCVAIIVPYRDLHASQKRAAHLAKFIPHMTAFLSKLVKNGRLSDYHIYIVEQSDDQRKFNRGKLLNIGFDLARKNNVHHDVFIFHDVDLLPQENLEEAYSHFPKTPYHIARVWDRYANNPKYFGGVVSFSSSDYKRINGYPNTFWGWGGEDDELQKRCEKLGIQWEWPAKGTLEDLEEMTLTQKLDFLRENKQWKCMVKWEALDEHVTTWKTNGLADLNYKVLKTETLDPKNKSSKITVDVKLNGNNHWANEKCGVDFMGDWNNKK
jgi:hypothetical protein